jgi:hypothetical protein
MLIFQILLQEDPEAEALEVMTIFSSVLQGCELRSLNLSDNALVRRVFGHLGLC